MKTLTELKMRIFQEKIDFYSLLECNKYQLQYCDYEDDTWTVPVLLTHERAYKIKHDKSISKVKIILPESELVLFAP